MTFSSLDLARMDAQQLYQMSQTLLFNFRDDGPPPTITEKEKEKKKDDEDDDNESTSSKSTTEPSKAVTLYRKARRINLKRIYRDMAKAAKEGVTEVRYSADSPIYKCFRSLGPFLIKNGFTAVFSLDLVISWDLNGKEDTVSDSDISSDEE
jgi:hypothetical protein